MTKHHHMRNPNLPADVASTRELVERFLAQDANLSTRDLQRRIHDAFNLDINASTVANVRARYRSSIGLSPQTTNGRARARAKAQNQQPHQHHKETKANEGMISIDATRHFIQAVKNVGGREMAETLLSLFGD